MASKETVQPQKSLPQPNTNEIIDLPEGQLLFDEENPRLTMSGEKSQDSLLRVLWKEMSVDEVAWSIAENGFFPSEPLFVIIKNANETNPGRRRYIVVEGNRRLAAVRLLRDEKWRKIVGAAKDDLPAASQTRVASLESVPAIIFSNRRILWPTVGFRHINGIKPWNSISKARYVVSVHEHFGICLDDIAAKIGDRHETVIKMYRGYKVLEQAEKETVFRRNDVYGKLSFSHLYTALDQRPFQVFLGIDPSDFKPSQPVPKQKIPHLEELMLWLFGKKSSSIEPVVRVQNPDLNVLRKIIEKPEALSALRSKYTLERAYALALGDKKRFRDSLISAKLELQNAKSTVTTGYSGEEDLYDVAEEIVLYAKTILEEMNKTHPAYSTKHAQKKK